MKLSWPWWVLLGVVAFLAPLPIGSIATEWSMPLALAILTLGGYAAVVRPLIRGERPSFPRALVPIMLLVIWTAIPLVPLPESVVAVLSPERLTVPEVPGTTGPIAMSLYAGATLEQTILLLSVLYLMWAVATAESARAAFRLVAVIGVAHALLGLFLVETGGSGRIPGTGTTRIFWVYVADEVLSPFGSFVNKNHFAGLMLIGAGGCMAILFRRWRTALRVSEGLSLRARIPAITGRGFFRLLVPALGLLAILGALFSSGSRGATAALLAACVGVPVLSGLAVRRLRLLPVAAGLLLVVGAMLAASAGSSVSVVERLIPEGRFMNRPRLWHDVLVMTGRYPLFGIGAGTFEIGFPRYQTFDDQRRFTHAEGDWIQYLGENGIPGALMLFVFGVVLIRRFLRLVRGSGTNAALAVGGGIGLAGVVLHGCVDTGLHMPANLVAAAILTGGLLALPVSARGPLD